MTGKRQPLPGIDDFQPRGRSEAASEPAGATRKVIDEASQFPSREVADEDQINIRGSRSTIDRFRRLCKTERYKYVEMLSILLDTYEKNQRT